MTELEKLQATIEGIEAELMVIRKSRDSWHDAWRKSEQDSAGYISKLAAAEAERDLAVNKAFAQQTDIIKLRDLLARRPHLVDFGGMASGQGYTTQIEHDREKCARLGGACAK